VIFFNIVIHNKKSTHHVAFFSVLKTKHQRFMTFDVAQNTPDQGIMLRVRGVRDRCGTVFIFGVYVETKALFSRGTFHMDRGPCPHNSLYVIHFMLRVLTLLVTLYDILSVLPTCSTPWIHLPPASHHYESLPVNPSRPSPRPGV